MVRSQSFTNNWLIGYIQKDVVISIVILNIAQEKTSEIISTYIANIKL